ncbi:MAG: hypothetical protein KC656_22000 [Myxococcales bacterium]|nr:hypothetical protein [Myxococcales bacterium]
MNRRTMTPPERADLEISRIRAALLRRLPFFGALALELRLHVTDTPGFTAGVSATGDLIVGPRFQEHNRKRRAWIMVHEVMHCASGHFARRGDRDHERWNEAADYAINLLIPNDDTVFERPPDCLYDERFRGLSAEEIFDILSQEQSHDGGSEQSNSTEPDNAPGAGSDMLPKPNPGEALAAAATWKGKLSNAVRAHQDSGRGDLPGDLAAWVGEVLEPKIDWREQLARWLDGKGRSRRERSGARWHRRSWGLGWTLAGHRRQGPPTVAVIWDTSGSLVNEAPAILAEVQEICDETGNALRLLACDTRVTLDVTVDDVSAVELVGGGGSNMVPAFDRLDDESFDGLVICFTDGAIRAPETPAPSFAGVLWALVGTGARRPRTWGDDLTVPGGA